MTYHLGSDQMIEARSAVGLLAVDGDLVTDRRNSDPVDRLSRELNLACTTSINPHQIAALLESEGLNDRIVRERYSRPDVFALAAELYDRVPLRSFPVQADDSNEGQDHVQDVVGALLMRGPIYLLPALFFVAARELLVNEEMMVAGLVALFLAWAWNQGFGALVHRMIGRTNVAAAKSMARLSLVAGTVAVALTASLVVPGAYGDLPTVLFAAGQTAYLIAAATLLTLGKDRMVAFALLPGLAMLGLLVIPGMPAWVAAAAMVVTLALVVGAMMVETRSGKRTKLRSLSRTDISVAGLYALLGAIWASLIGLAGFGIADTPGLIGTVSIAAAPMVLTMGVAEWQLLHLRRGAKVLLRRTATPQKFAHVARRAFVRSLVVLAAALAATSTMIVAVSYGTGALLRFGTMLAFGFFWLALAFFAGLVLLSLGRILVPLAASALVAALVAFSLVFIPHVPLGGAGIFAAGCFVLFTMLVGVVLTVIPKAVVHR